MRVRILVAAALLLSLIGGTFGCKSHSAAPAITERRFPLEGRVIAADTAAHTLTLDHHEIPGYMKAMTMPFTVRTDWVFNYVHPGDTVQATLVVGDDAWLDDVVVTQSRGSADLYFQ